MNAVAEQALVAILVGYAPLAAEIKDRATWDDTELDVAKPAVTLRSLASVPASPELRGRGGIMQAQVEVASRAVTYPKASQVADLVVAALDPYESGPDEVTIDAGTVRFASIRLTNVQQGPSTQQHSYRKVLTYTVSFYE